MTGRTRPASVMRLPTTVAAQGVTLTFTDLMRNPTLSAWHSLIAGTAPAPEAAVQADADASFPLTAPFPLTEVQRAYWLGRNSLFELGGVAAHGYLEVEADDLDPDRLEHAINRTVERHPMLRATIGEDGLQRIALSVPPPYRIARLDLRAADPAERQTALETVRRAMRQAVLPADRWPLFDIRVTRL